MDKNRDFKIKLIFPCRFEMEQNYFSSNYYFPYGMSVLAAFLRKHNYYVEQEDLSVKLNRNYRGFLSPKSHNKILDINKNYLEIEEFSKSEEIGKELSTLIDKIEDCASLDGFDIVGFSIVSYLHFLFALILAKRIKQKINVPIIFGGPFITLYGHLYLQKINFIDYMIVGDGMIPLLRLIGYLNNEIPLSEVPNLVYAKNSRLNTNFIEHYPLEGIPIPDFNGLHLDLYKNSRHSDITVFPYQISRGCVGKCSFCDFININKKIEFKSFDKVISELFKMKQIYNSKWYHFCDDTINNSYEYLEKMCDFFIINKLEIQWSCMARVGNLDKDILNKMRKAGCWHLTFGIETGSYKILKSMNKGFTPEQSSQTLRDSAEAGLMNCIDLIPGYPFETREDIQETILFIRKNKKYIHDVRFYKFALSYGSFIYSNPDKFGITDLRQTELRFVFAFNELGGLKWAQKQKQQEDSQRLIEKAVKKYIRFKKFLY